MNTHKTNKEKNDFFNIFIYVSAKHFLERYITRIKKFYTKKKVYS